MKYSVDDIKICVYTICKDEEMFANRWLLSAQEADAIFVNDTGSTDKTVEILEKHPKVKLIHSKFTGNKFRFDSAWNEVLDIIPDTFDFYVRLDMDMMLTCGWCQIMKKEILKQFNEKFFNLAVNNVDIGVYQEQDPYDEDDTVTIPFYVGYVHSYSKECKYYGAVHEDFSNHSFKTTKLFFIDQKDLRFIHTKKRRNTENDLYEKLAKERFYESPTYFNFFNWVCSCNKNKEEALLQTLPLLNEVSESANDVLTRLNFTLFMEKKEKTSRFYMLCFSLLYTLFCLKDIKKSTELYEEILKYKNQTINIKDIYYFYGSVYNLYVYSSIFNEKYIDVEKDIIFTLLKKTNENIVDYTIYFFESYKDILKGLFE